MTDTQNRRQFAPNLEEYFRQNAGREVTLAEIQTEFPGKTPLQVASGIHNVKRSGRIEIDVLVPGRRWRFDPSKAQRSPSGKRLFEELATTKDGTILVQCEDGSIYKLVEIG